MKSKSSGAPALVQLCCRVLEEKKASNIAVLDVGAQSSITDYLIVATATSEPHLRALRIELEKALDGAGARIIGIESGQASGWVVIDVFDVMIHLFFAATREHFALERLWQDARPVQLSKILARKRLAAGRAKSAKKSASSK